MVVPLLCLSFTFLVPAVRMDDEQAFEAAPPPSFASPGPSPETSPRADPDEPPPMALAGEERIQPIGEMLMLKASIYSIYIILYDNLIY